eukprot:TRINITY_DN890_c0_g1_i1.p3 TRINITY_DN890_c0_g1~~TRINITY_DN890_c0_g1_i1.p3  ORF type:complete len:119 (+),score=22.13 TRINITY_DN890_c0_g1_i1:307-663(+)
MMTLIEVRDRQIAYDAATLVSIKGDVDVDVVVVNSLVLVLVLDFELEGDGGIPRWDSGEVAAGSFVEGGDVEVDDVVSGVVWFEADPHEESGEAEGEDESDAPLATAASFAHFLRWFF